jgi:hypothetical protein
MEAATHTDQHQHHEMPTSGGALTKVAISATLHCLTGCAIGEVAGMLIGTALGFSNLGTIVLSIALAFAFGYGLTSLPLLRAGLALSAVVPIALASDTLSIATMEIVDNAIMVSVPGAMNAGLGQLLFWGSLAFALVIAGALAVPVNRWLIGRGKGHAVVHETGVHGGPSPKTVGAVAAVAFVFGSSVLVAEAATSDGAGHGGHGGMAMEDGGHRATPAAREQGHGGMAGHENAGDVRGLAVTSNGLTLSMQRDTELPLGRRTQLRFRVLDSSGRPVRNFEVEHTKRLHFIVVRRDLTGFQHLHPTMGADGTWTTPLTLREAGSYRAFADFKRTGRNETLASDLFADGKVDFRPLPPATPIARTGDGYEVRIAEHPVRAGKEAELHYTATRNGKPVTVEPYLGARGHLVALRQGDLAYLHVHPLDGAAEGNAITFATKFPTAGRYRLFLQFKEAGRVRTAAFTQEVTR